MLSDTNKCSHTSEQEANCMLDDVETQLQQFLDDYSAGLTRLDKQHIARCTSQCTVRHSFFRTTAKAHKPELSFRPIALHSGSLLFAAGRWLDQQLQPIVKKLPSHFASSYDLKQDLQSKHFDPTAHSFFACDATAMFDNTPHNHAFEETPNFLRTSELAV